MPDVTVRLKLAASLPRPDSESPSEAEDRWAIFPDVSREADGLLRAAVADGASDSLFAGEWAEELVRAYCHRPDPRETGLPPLDGPRSAWWNAHQGKKLPWYLEAKRARGAAAALVGITFLPESGTWNAVAVGDSCLFHWRDGALRNAFPLETMEAFAGLPLLLHTNPLPGKEVPTQTRSDTCLSGDLFFLMSDALALWFLREQEAEKQPVNWLRDLTSPREFAERTQVLRTSGRLKQDDTTLISLEVV